MEVQFTQEVERLRQGAGTTFHGEGILAVTKALLQSGVAYVGGYQGAPVSHLLDVMVQARDYMDELGVHVEACTNESSAAAMLAASIMYPVRGAVTWKSVVGTNVASDALSNLASPGVMGGALIVVGDTVHNFVDGVLIAAAFLQSPELGLVTAVAIVAHEIPQEVGDFLVLLHSGYSKAKAFALNILSSMGSVVGGVLGYFTLQGFERWEPIVLGIVAASMIYVAVADLIPGLHKRPELRATAQQALLIAAGVGVIFLVR